MSRKYELKCFNCLTVFKNKNEVFRNKDGHPLCEYHFIEAHELEFTLEAHELETILRRFNGSIVKWEEFLKTCISCDTCEYLYEEKNIKRLEGKAYCLECYDNEVEFQESREEILELGE